MTVVFSIHLPFLSFTPSSRRPPELTGSALPPEPELSVPGPCGWGREGSLKLALSTLTVSVPLKERRWQGSEGSQGPGVSRPCPLATPCQASQRTVQREPSPGSPVSPSGLSAVPSHHLQAGPTRQGVHRRPCPWPLGRNIKASFGLQSHGQAWLPEFWPLSRWPLLLLAAVWTQLDWQS